MIESHTQAPSIRTAVGRAEKRRVTIRAVSGFTLFELLIAVALSVVVTGLVGAALVFYGQTLQKRDVEVREAQLARAALRMLAEDLQATVRPPVFDRKALEETLSGGLSSGVAGAAGGGAEGGLSGDAADAVGLGGESDGSRDLSTEIEPPPRPGLLGTQFQLQLDISRLPRTDQYRPVGNSSFSLSLQDIPSDLKTVTYYVQQAGTTGIVDPWTRASGSGQRGQTSPRGLVRRELDRAVTMWAQEAGNIQQLWRTGELLAKEVVAIQFAYYDGQQWLMQWDSEQMGSLPIAVRISLLVDPHSEEETDEPPTLFTGLTSIDQSRYRQYEQIVRLPMADPIAMQIKAQQGGASTTGEL
jgi:type II secretory pathway pseudopilin PulG